MSATNEDAFVDILADRRNGSSDLSWAMKKWDVAPCRYSKGRTPQQIKQHVLSGEKLKAIIQIISEKESIPEAELEKRAKKIVDEMAHEFDFRVIRFFGYTLSKFMKSVYGKILVNKKGVEKIGAISSQYPILFLPTHRSYSDFLLVSYICFYFNLPMPVIAAGLDFLGLRFLSFLLRGAGAFFIRRSFVDDLLYKCVFHLYVQTHIEGADFPIEFFIEGTRSRSAKSLNPKLGMLQAILHMYFSSKVPDITVVPISICYDRTLEEMLYAYELLGVPKPKESTTGLIKARKVMSDYYGNVYVRFGEPISLKDYFKGYDRSVHNLHPRDNTVVDPSEHALCANLANHVVRMHQCNLLLSPFPLVCLLLGEVPLGTGLHFNHLVESVRWMEELVRKSGATIYIDSGNISKALTDQLHLHSNFIHMTDDFYVSIQSQRATSSATPSAPHLNRLSSETIASAVPIMLAQHYANQALQLLVHMCMVCLCVESSNQTERSQDEIFYRYKILRHLLQKEFTFEREAAEKDFLHAVESLKEEKILRVNECHLALRSTSVEKVLFLGNMLLPFVQAYYLICKFIIKLGAEHSKSRRQLMEECQSFIEEKIEHGDLKDYRCLSLDIAANCINFLVNQAALTVSSKSETTYSSHVEISNIAEELEWFLPSSKVTNQRPRFHTPAAKL